MAGLFADNIDLDYDGEDTKTDVKSDEDDTDMSPGAMALKAIEAKDGAAFEEAIRKIK